MPAKMNCKGPCLPHCYGFSVSTIITIATLCILLGFLLAVTWWQPMVILEKEEEDYVRTT